MDGDVVRAQPQAGVQRPAEALRVVLRKTRDQIHVDVVKSGGGRLFHGGENLRCRMAAADGLQYPVFHGLGFTEIRVMPWRFRTCSFSGVTVSGRPASTVYSPQAAKSNESVSAVSNSSICSAVRVVGVPPPM